MRTVSLIQSRKQIGGNSTNTTICAHGEADCLPQEQINVIVSAILFSLVVGLSLFLFIRRMLKKRNQQFGSAGLRYPYMASESESLSIRDRTQSESTGSEMSFNYQHDNF